MTKTIIQEGEVGKEVRKGNQGILGAVDALILFIVMMISYLYASIKTLSQNLIHLKYMQVIMYQLSLKKLFKNFVICWN